MSSLLEVKVNEIRENPESLRDVDRESPEYLELVDSIRKNGVLKPILIREVASENGTLFGLVDGLQRLSAARDAGLSKIPCHVKNMDEAGVLEAQIIANVQSIKTTDASYSKQLNRILELNPTLTAAELADRLSKSTQWLNDILRLVKLTNPIQELVNEGKIVLANAIALAKLAAVAPDEQELFLERAMTTVSPEFVPMLNARIKEIKDAKKQGRAAAPAEYLPQPVYRKIAESKDEMVSASVAKRLVTTLQISDPVDAFSMGVRWALQMDPETVAKKKADYEKRQQEIKDAKERRKKEREEQKKSEAVEATAAAS